MIKQDDFSVQLLPGMLQMVEEHQRAGQQPDNLCGPYWAALLLRSRGFHLTSEHIAQGAGSVLPSGDPVTWLPQGAQSKQDYELPLPIATSAEAAGTSAQGLIAAVSELSEHRYILLPLQAEWSAERVDAVLELCQQNPAWNAVPLCNVRTGHLWGSHLSVKDAIDHLSGGLITAPPADWNVGHFLVLAGIVTGQAPLVIVCDTYPMFGWQGYHLQSKEAIAQALNRDDGYSGGILLFIATQDREQVAQQAQDAGFLIEVWDNGSP